jgi:xanthine dehydrogenase accessory factor
MESNFRKKIIVVRGAGEMTTGVIHRLYNSGYMVIALEQQYPVCVRRMVCFANAIYEKQFEIEGVQSNLVNDIDEALEISKNKIIPVLVDAKGNSIKAIDPVAVIDGRMLKKDVDTTITSSPILIGLGPGFTVGQNCHAVVETNRGENLGKVILEGKAQEYTGIPAEVKNYTNERVLRSPANGNFITHSNIGDSVKANDIIGSVNNVEVISQIDGVIRGLIHNSVVTTTNQKIGDIEPSGNKNICYKISDKANAIGNGVLEALHCLGVKQ